jgi:hypothetical protein
MDLLYTTVQTDAGAIRIPNAGLLASAVGPRPPKNSASPPENELPVGPASGGAPE